MALRLFSLDKTALLIVKLRLKVLDLLLQPGSDLPASLDSLLLSLVQLRLHVLHLALEGTAVLLGVLGVLLLCSELIGQASSINHCLLGLVFSNASLAQHLLEIRLQSLQFGVEFPLSCLKCLILEGGITQLLHDIRKLLLSSSPLSIGVLQLGLCLLQLVGHSMVVPLCLDQALPGLVPHDLLLLQRHLGDLDLLLVFLDCDL